MANCATPPCLKWAENMRGLLDDPDGLRLFKSFAAEEETPELLDFYLACRGLEKMPQVESPKVHSLMRVLYTNYVKRGSVPLSAQVKTAFSDALRQPDRIGDQRILTSAREEVETRLSETLYPNFLTSDLFMKHMQAALRSGTGSGGSGSDGDEAIGMTTSLATVEEEPHRAHSTDEAVALELAGGPLSEGVDRVIAPITAENLLATRYTRASDCQPALEKAVVSKTVEKSRAPHPYHISFTTVSAAGSDRQSAASSDAIADDAEKRHQLNSLKKSHRSASRLAQQNKDQGVFIPRTDRPVDRTEHNLASVDPGAFARKLTEKLKELATEVATRTALQQFTETTQADRRHYLNEAVRHMTASSDNAQQILDSHVSKVWDSPSSLSRSYHSHRTAQPLTERDTMSCSSYDSGVGCVVPSRHIFDTRSYRSADEPHKHRRERPRRDNRAESPTLPSESRRHTVVVGWQFMDEKIPYRSQLAGSRHTLGQFRQLITKRGKYKFFFKRRCDDFQSQVVFEEINDDAAILPLYDGKIFAKVVRVDS